MHLSCRSIRPSSLVQTAGILLIVAGPLLAQGPTEAGIPVTDRGAGQVWNVPRRRRAGKFAAHFLGARHS